MYSYVFMNNDWIESRDLYPHDIALLIYPEEEKMYLWKGPYAREELVKSARTQAETMVQKYDFKYTELDNSKIPLKIQIEIDELLGENKEFVSDEVPRSPAMVIFYYLGYLGIVAMVFLVLNMFRFMGEDRIEGAILINEHAFQDIFDISIYLAVAAAAIFLGCIICGAFTQRIFLVIAPLVSLAIAVGTFFYLGNREFLLYFHESEFIYDYLIDFNGMIMVFSWLFVALICSAIPILVANKAIRDTSVPVEKETGPVEIPTRISLLDGNEKRKMSQISRN